MIFSAVFCPALCASGFGQLFHGSAATGHAYVYGAGFLVANDVHVLPVLDQGNSYQPCYYISPARPGIKSPMLEVWLQVHLSLLGLQACAAFLLTCLNNFPIVSLLQSIIDPDSLPSGLYLQHVPPEAPEKRGPERGQPRALRAVERLLIELFGLKYDSMHSKCAKSDGGFSQELQYASYFELRIKSIGLTDLLVPFKRQLLETLAPFSPVRVAHCFILERSPAPHTPSRPLFLPDRIGASCAFSRQTHSRRDSGYSPLPAESVLKSGGGARLRCGRVTSFNHRLLDFLDCAPRWLLTLNVAWPRPEAHDTHGAHSILIQ